MKPTIDTMEVVVDGSRQERLVIRGVIDPNTVDAIGADVYQREIIPGSKVRALVEAAKSSVLPDIELGMRGDGYRVMDQGKPGENFLIISPVYVIDGAQRINAIRVLLKQDPTATPRIGAVVHVDTTFDWERNRFRILNQERSRLSPSVLLRNACPDHIGLAAVHAMCGNDDAFVLRGRVTWEQRQKRNELMTAARVCASVAVLHSRFVDAGSRSDDMRDVPLVLDRQFETVGPNIFRANIRLFFDLIDQCWGLKNIVYRESAPQVKGTFIRVLADLFQSYDTFWRDKRLFVNAGWMKKLAKFNLQDPTVINLCGSGGKARQILFHLLLDHMNSGRRNGKLAADDTIDGDNGDE